MFNSPFLKQVFVDEHGSIAILLIEPYPPGSHFLNRHCRHCPQKTDETTHQTHVTRQMIVLTTPFLLDWIIQHGTWPIMAIPECSDMLILKQSCIRKSEPAKSGFPKEKGFEGSPRRFPDEFSLEG